MSYRHNLMYKELNKDRKYDMRGTDEIASRKVRARKNKYEVERTDSHGRLYVLFFVEEGPLQSLHASWVTNRRGKGEENMRKRGNRMREKNEEDNGERVGEIRGKEEYNKRKRIIRYDM